MSGEARPNGSPVKPPIPNIGKKEIANSMGVLNRIDPPHKEINKQVKMMTDGIEIIMVVVWKNALITVPILVKYMWWAQTIKDKNPRPMME